jgi:phage gp36-like protein
MSYITNADIQERLGNDTYVSLTDDNRDGAADVGVVDEARLAAEGEVNSFLARRYRVPIDLTLHPELGDLVASVTLDVAEYRLRLRRPPVSEDARRRHAQTLDWLSRVADGRIDLPSIIPPATGTARGIVVQISGEERLLSREELADH